MDTFTILNIWYIFAITISLTQNKPELQLPSLNILSNLCQHQDVIHVENNSTQSKPSEYLLR